MIKYFESPGVWEKIEPDLIILFSEKHLFVGRNYSLMTAKIAPLISDEDKLEIAVF